MKIGVLGLGRMGGAMAARLIAAGHDVSVYDPVKELAVRLGEQGATVAASIAQMCEGREVVLSVLPTDDALDAAALAPGGLVENIPVGAIHLISGTHGTTLIEQVSKAHQKAGQVLVVCTLLGRPERAVEGKLGLIAGGPAASVAKLKPVLSVLGDKIFEAGESPLSAVVAKLANSFVLGCAIEAIGEGMSLVRSYDIDPILFYDVLTSGLFDCVAYRAYGDLIAKQDWNRIGAPVSIGLKDGGMAFEAASKKSITLPSWNIWRDHLLSARRRGEEGLDWAVMAREQFRRSGLED